MNISSREPLLVPAETKVLVLLGMTKVGGNSATAARQRRFTLSA
jgi:hypothetical protein